MGDDTNNNQNTTKSTENWFSEKPSENQTLDTKQEGSSIPAPKPTPGAENLPDFSQIGQIAEKETSTHTTIAPETTPNNTDLSQSNEVFHLVGGLTGDQSNIEKGVPKTADGNLSVPNDHSLEDLAAEAKEEVAPIPSSENKINQSNTNSNQPEIPHEVYAWDTGAFLGSWLWALSNRVWIGVLALIPGLWLIVSIVLGIKGGLWAWQKKPFTSLEEFKKSRVQWTKFGFILFIISLAVTIFSFLVVYSAYKNQQIQSQNDVFTGEEYYY